MDGIKEETRLKKYLLVSTLLLTFASGAVWSAPVQSFPAVMQSVGTFDGGAPAAKITVFAAPDEFEPASFIIKPTKAFSGVTLKLAGDLTTGKTAIPADKVTLSSVEESKLIPDAAFDLQAGETKRFWMTIDVPVRTAPGMYKSAVLAVAGGQIIGKLPIELNVLGIRLLKSSKRNGIMLPQTQTIDETYIKTLRDMRVCGFGCATVTTPVSQMSEAVKTMRQERMAGLPIVCASPDLTMDTIATANQQAKAVALRNMLICVASEPCATEEVQTACEMAQAIHNARMKSFAVVNDEAALDQLLESLDAVNYHVSLQYVQGLLTGGKRAAGRNEWIYWDATASPKDNRVYSGLALWKTGLDGMFLPMDSPEALIGTVQWEALREGIDDTRYLTSLMSLVRQAKDLGKAKDVTDAAEAYVNAVLAKPLTQMANKDYQGYRLQIAQYIAKLQTVVK